MPNTSSTATGSPPIQRSRAPSNGREPPTSARNMSAAPHSSADDSVKLTPAQLKDQQLLKVMLNKATPPPTPPRINTPSVMSPPHSGCTSPNPPLPLTPTSSSKPSLFTSLKVHFKPTPPATPPRPSPSPYAGTPNVLSPAPATRPKLLSASTPNNAAPKVVEDTTRQRALAESVEISSPMLTRRARAPLPMPVHALAASSRTSDVVCTPPRVQLEVPSSNPISTLKTSHGLSIVKSPRAKDYLLSQLAVKPAVPLTRSKSPPPRTSVALCASPTAVRKLSEPVPVQYDHLRRNILTGSEGISMPYNVTHTTHIDHTNMHSMVPGTNVIVINNNVPLYEKSGHMYKLAGSTFKERWVECRRSTLSYYAKKDSSKPRREIHLSDCEFERDKASKRPHTIHLIHTPTRKSYYFAAPDAEAHEEWVRVYHSSGAVDRDFVTMEKDQKEKEKKQEEARKVREMRKQEDEYVKEKLKKRSTLRLINKNMTNCAMEVCLCTLKVQEVVEKESGHEFQISVTFDDQSWTIYRNFEKLAKMYDAMTKLKFVKGMCPPRKCPSNMKQAEFTQLQISKLQALLDLLARNRPCVLASSTPKQRFLRFIAPVGWDDIKPEDFVMPFQFDF